MSNTEYTDEQIKKFASRDMVIAWGGGPFVSRYEYLTQWFSDETIGGAYYGITGDRTTARFGMSKTFHRYPHENRMVGIIDNVNTDESFDIRIIGSDTLRNNSHSCNIRTISIVVGENEDGKVNIPGIVSDNDMHVDDIEGNVDYNEWFDYVPTWRASSGVRGFFSACTEKGSDNMNTNIILTDDVSNALRVGKPLNGVPIFTNWKEFPFLGAELYDACSGNLWELMQDYASLMQSSIQKREAPDATTRALPSMILSTDIGNTFAFYWKPYNLILTESEALALNYLRTGEIPSDAIIYPWDPDTFPKYQNDDTQPPDDGGDDPDEDGSPSDNLPDTPDVIPDVTPQRLTNNNLYWLSASELDDFINWFWTDAGEVASVESLWEKIQGLYNNLASAVINIRFMPVKPAWIGGVTSTNSIIVGNIERSLQTNVSKIAKNNPTKQVIGDVDIKQKIESIKTVKGFTNFSPYSQLTLYLPFHGFLDIDNDIFMDSKLQVKALYDIITGTIQYEIYRIKNNKSTLINVIPCKMALDIPITLQSKSERDSAIFQNITGLAGSLVTGGISLAMGNPIGLVMGASQIANGVASAGANSIPMSLKGSPQETGAFYSPNRCAIYIRRPVYNKPKLYKSRVGYPCNKSYKLSNDNISGFTQCYNPVIKFTNTAPLQSEVDEIYNYLEKGVIL